MSDDSFACKKCGALLIDPMISVYRAVISSGGSVSGAIRCGKCGSIYSAQDISLSGSNQNIFDDKIDEKLDFKIFTEASDELINTKIITVEASTVKEAKRVLLKQKPEGAYLYAVKVLDHGGPYNVRDFGETVDSAFSAVLKRLKNNSEILEKKIISHPENILTTVKANNDSEAQALALRGLPIKKANIISVFKREDGRRGFLKIGKTLNTYEVNYFLNAEVEICAQAKALIQGKIGLFPRSPPSQFTIWVYNHKKEFSLKTRFEALASWYLKHNIALELNNVLPILYNNSKITDLDYIGILSDFEHYLSKEKNLKKIINSDALNKKYSNEEEFILAIASTLYTEHNDLKLLFYHKGIALFPDWN
jgi:hypothetical protein